MITGYAEPMLNPVFIIEGYALRSGHLPFMGIVTGVTIDPMILIQWQNDPVPFLCLQKVMVFR